MPTDSTSTDLITNLSSLEKKRHGAAHILAMAVLKLFPGAKLAIGPTIENGFYYDFKLPRPIAPSDLESLTKQMREIVKQDLAFERSEMGIVEATKFFEDQPFKIELIRDLERDGETTVSLYRTGDFIDLCRGGHIASTKEINPHAFKLTKTAGAYWRGDENRPMLTRIYAVLFATEDELNTHLTLIEQAEKRDHKKLGKELDLFIFSELVGAGLPLWTPKGTVIRELLDDYVWQLRRAKGYQRVTIPHLTKKDLYEKSGHWSKFADELFRTTTREGHEFALKPMNCPHHAQIYAAKLRSYRNLPQRYTETTMVYRDEQTGELGGLNRVRAITQDDAHIFCRQTQVQEEVMAVWDIVDQFYKTFGFELNVRFSRHDPAKLDKYLGSQATWEKAEKKLLAVIGERGLPYTDGLGEAAMYGPKIDFLGTDALGRQRQVATIQLDLNQPESFDLTCINEQGEQERIVMIHAAIMGSLERFMAVIIEHYAGAFPVWLSPVQVTLIPVSDKFLPFVQQHILVPLQAADIRVELDDANESVGKKIRNATGQKIPYMIVIGEKEVESGALAVRSRDQGELGAVGVAEFIARLKSEIENHQ